MNKLAPDQLELVNNRPWQHDSRYRQEDIRDKASGKILKNLFVLSYLETGGCKYPHRFYTLAYRDGIGDLIRWRLRYNSGYKGMTDKMAIIADYVNCSSLPLEHFAGFKPQQRAKN